LIGILIKYTKFHGKPIPEEPMALLSLLPKTEILATIVKINSLLQPMGYRTIDDSRKTQIECLKAILLQDEENAPEEYILRFKRYAEYLLSSSEFVSIFTRVTCLYALNEILQSDDFYNEEKSQYTFEERSPILDYLLICNERVLEFSENSTLEEIVDNKIDFFEFNAFNQLPHNQYYFNVNLLSKLYRSRYFLNVLLANEKTSHHLKKYFKVKFNISDIPEFYKVFFWSFMHMNDETLKTYYLNIPKDENGVLNVIRGFASPTIIDKVNHEDVGVLDFLVVKKNPIYEWQFYASDEFVGFLILDQKFLLDKIDGLFINDFWFDYLKEHSQMNRKDWGNFIGSEYFEPFVGEIIQNSLRDRRDYSVKMFNDLKIKYDRNNEVEIADVYVRHKQRILLAEVKSNFINMIDGYKSITSLEDFKNLDLEKFYKSFGLKQLVEKTIKQFNNYKGYLKDDGLDLNRKVSLFPVVIVNEPILSSGLFQFPLRLKFESMLERENIQMKTKEHLIWPLLIINIEELQELEQSLKDNSVGLFDILMSFHDKTRILRNTKQKINSHNELLSMTNIINQKLEVKKLFPERLREYEWVLSND
jgi:hypothetical protein